MAVEDKTQTNKELKDTQRVIYGNELNARVIDATQTKVYATKRRLKSTLQNAD